VGYGLGAADMSLRPALWQRVAHAACDAADDDRAASHPVEVAIENDASSVLRDFGR